MTKAPMTKAYVKSPAPLKVGIAGLGVVGAGVVRLLDKQAGMLAARAGRPIKVVAVSARDKRKKRDMPKGTWRWYTDALDLVSDPEVEVVVELIGGSEGKARALVEAALKAGKGVVTANKALLAMHGTKLAAMAETKDAPLAFEAAVAGGIPILKALREGLVGNRIERITGILNGTCNYILTEMRQTGRDFGVVLKEAQQLGYAEADPSFDVDGIDAAHKLAVLTSLAFNTQVDFKAVHVKASAMSRRSTSLSPRNSATASSCWRLRIAPRAESSSACIPAWCHRIRRLPMSMACSTPWRPKVTMSVA